jgi:hypothetical protein
VFDLYIERKNEMELLLEEFGKHIESQIANIIEEYVSLIDNAADEKAKRAIQTVSILIRRVFNRYLGAYFDSEDS